MAREIGWQETKIRFFALKVPKMTKIVSSKTGNELTEEAGRMTSQSRSMFVSLVFVKCLSDETYILLANIDIQ